jgi:RND family efflux transporter MFP subunit
MSRKTTHVWAVALAGVAGSFLLLRVLPRKVQAEPSGPSGNAAPTVAVVAATRGDIARTVKITAEFRPYQLVDVMAKVSGYVKQIRVDVGDRVHSGDLLATLEVPEMADDRKRAEAELQRYQAEQQRAQEELSRAMSAHQISHLNYRRLDEVLKTRPGLVAQQEVDDAHGRDLVGEAQVSAARAALAAAQQQVHEGEAELAKIKTLIDYTHVTAPFTGVVTKRYADTGSMIQAGTASQIQARPVVTLAQEDVLRLTLPVPESAVPSIHVGGEVEVAVASLNRSFRGKVARYARSVDPATRTMETEVDVPNPDLILVPGMFAEATITLEDHPGAVLIPSTVISDRDTHPWVLVVDARNRIAKRNVQLGIEDAGRVQVLSGVEPGESLIVGERSALWEGEPVRPKKVEIGGLTEMR